MANVIIPNKDFNFTYMQEIINCYCAKRGRINEKTEDGKKGIVPNFKKSQREARKCKMAYKIELDKIKVILLLGTQPEPLVQSRDPRTKNRLVPYRAVRSWS